VSDFTYSIGTFRWNGNLPKALVKRKTFVSYYHHDDQLYRERFENLFGDLIVSKSVQQDDIKVDNSADYIKQLIQCDYLHDTTVLVVLVGRKTYCRKHVDWELSGALDLKVGDAYSGIIGLLLPTHPDYGKTEYTTDLLPKRLAANVKSGYALLYDWTNDRMETQRRIEACYNQRKESDKIVNRSIAQMQKNSCD
jgi:hypothetical protein